MLILRESRRWQSSGYWTIPSQSGLLGIRLEMRAFVPTLTSNITVLIIVTDDTLGFVLENLHRRQV